MLPNTSITTPDVSVLMITYGHEMFIEKAIEGVIKQNYQGIIELVISNDNSPDLTDEVIKNYLNKISVPENIIIKHHTHIKNIGALKNFLWTIEKCSGKYIAMCEGDDYWIDPLKIQKQVDYLDTNRDCNLVYHRVYVLQEDGKLTPEDLNSSNISLKRTLEDLVKNGNFMHTPSVMYRNNIQIPKEIFTDKIGDYVLWFLNGQKGKFGYLPDFMSVYRLWGGSIWGTKPVYFRTINYLKMLQKIIKFNKDKTIKPLFQIQARNNFRMLSIKNLTINQKFNLLKIIISIDPSYIIFLFKKLINFQKTT
ncbi:glycosyltransferase family 2 protein [Sphingobacterium lactis]|uniref:glycosyltransferase family 2 protein n=1 Tax=Sphingobacterium lactis TaxID=797291 RepID=UPI003EC84268